MALTAVLPPTAMLAKTKKTLERGEGQRKTTVRREEMHYLHVCVHVSLIMRLPASASPAKRKRKGESKGERESEREREGEKCDPFHTLQVSHLI